MKCRVTVDIPDGEGWVEALGLGRDGPVQQFHTANVLRRIKLTIAQTDTHVPEIVTDNPQARYLYYGMSKSGKSLNYTHTKNPLAGPRWDEAVMAAEGDAMAADLARYMRRMLK